MVAVQKRIRGPGGMWVVIVLTLTENTTMATTLHMLQESNDASGTDTIIPWKRQRWWLKGHKAVLIVLEIRKWILFL